MVCRTAQATQGLLIRQLKTSPAAADTSSGCWFNAHAKLSQSQNKCVMQRGSYSSAWLNY